MLTRKKYYLFLSLLLTISIICLCGAWHEIQPQNESQNFYQHMSRKGERLYANKESPEESIVLRGENLISCEPSTQSNHWILEMKKTCPDMIGWIRSKGMEIDYPVMQTVDNSYYLTHLPDGTYNKLGSIFLDRSAKSDFSSPVSVLYGHMVKEGKMFGLLKNYRRQDFYDKHPKLTLYTAEGEKDIILFAAYLVDGSSNPFPAGFATPEDFNSYIKEIKSKSFFKSTQTIVPKDKLIILSTCAYDFDNARLAVVGYTKTTKIY